jgi:hypothetical protein
MPRVVIYKLRKRDIVHLIILQEVNIASQVLLKDAI